MLKWLRFSGISVIITVNPFHWSKRPWANRFQDEWAGPKERTVSFGWLFLTVRAWKDDGSW
jgi:hypothetical protein